MVILRFTNRLRKVLQETASDADRSTAALGGWYANRVVLSVAFLCRVDFDPNEYLRELEEWLQETRCFASGTRATVFPVTKTVSALRDCWGSARHADEACVRVARGQRGPAQCVDSRRPAPSLGLTGSGGADRRGAPQSSIVHCSELKRPAMIRQYLLGVLATISALVATGCADKPALVADGPVGAVTLIEQVRIDGHEHTLVPISAVYPMHDGRLLVVQGLDRLVRVFSHEGDPIGAVGRIGSGPGEFQMVSRLGTFRDSLWVYDSVLKRVTFYAPDLSLARTSLIPDGLYVNERGTSVKLDFVSAAGITESAEFLIDGSTSAREHAPTRIYSVVVGNTGSVSRVNWRAEWSGDRIWFGGNSSPVPFANRPVHGTSPDGRHTAVAESYMDGAMSGKIRVVLVSSAGDTVYDREFPFTPRPISDSQADSAVEAAARRIRNPERAAAFARRAEIPRYYPAVRALVVALDGSIWLRVWSADQQNEYLVLGRDGMLRGTVQFPGNSRVAAADSATVWTIEKDRFDVESVVRSRLLWESDSP